jgi:GTPase SAR1 family protein
MLGERYFATRERLASLLHGILSFAAENGAASVAPLSSADVENELRAPVSLIACGEVNSGKSTLLNALCGQPLCPTGVLPVTDRFLRYRFGNPGQDAILGPDFEEKFRRIGFLEDVSLIDTPGTNSGKPGHLDLLENLAADADIVLCVFPVSNPWGAATWDFISRLPSAVLDRALLVIQQADLREAVDLDVIRGHMADLSLKKLGRQLPVFDVSGKLACEAGRMRESGLPALTDFITGMICESPPRRALLESWRSRAASALRAVEDHIDDRNRALTQHGRFVDGVEREIEDMRGQFVARLPRHLANVATVFETEAVGVSRLLHRKLGAAASILRLFTGDRTGQRMEAVFIERLGETIDAVAEKDGGEVADACAEHWQELGCRVHEAIGIPLVSPEAIEETLASARQRFVRRIGGAAREGIGSLKVRARLDKDLRARNVALRSFVVMTLVLTTAGASCGALGLPWLPMILCGLAALFLTGGAVVAWITRRTITRDFRERLLDTCGAFASTLHSDYDDALRAVFHDYVSALGGLRTQLAREKIAIEPRLKRWQELFLTLKAIEQDW